MAKFVFLLAGLVIGGAAGVLVQQPRTQPGRQFVERCRARRDAIAALPAEQQAVFWRNVLANQQLREKWFVTLTCARIQFSDVWERLIKTPEDRTEKIKFSGYNRDRDELTAVRP